MIRITKSSAIDAMVDDIVHRNVISNIWNATNVMSLDTLKKHVIETHDIQKTFPRKEIR